MKKQELLKVFIFTCTLSNDDIKSVFVTAYTEKEASFLFTRRAQCKDIYEQINGIVIQRAKKNKYNRCMFTKKYYEHQNDAVDKLYKKGAN